MRTSTIELGHIKTAKQMSHYKAYLLRLLSKTRGHLYQAKAILKPVQQLQNHSYVNTIAMLEPLGRLSLASTTTHCDANHRCMKQLMKLQDELMELMKTIEGTAVEHHCV
jgi:hypothetical protein